MKLFTIGFTRKSAEDFFNKLKRSGAKRVVDVRLNNNSQLAGFTKRNDLQFFLRDICDMDYVHVPELAPTQDILDEYKKNKGDWGVYEQKFLELMRNREIETNSTPYTEDTLVQQTTAGYLEQELGWESVYACNNDDFGPDD